MDYAAAGGFKRQHIPETTDNQEYPPPVRLPFEFIIDFLHDAMKHNIDKIGRRQIVPQYFQLYLGTEDRETRRQYEDILIEELIYSLKVIRDEYFKNEHDPLVIEIADDAELARFEVGVAVRMVNSTIVQISDFDKTSQLETIVPTVLKSEPDTTIPEPSITSSPIPEVISNDVNAIVQDDVYAEEMKSPVEVDSLDDNDLEKKFRFMVDEAKKNETAKPTAGVVDLAVNVSSMESDDSEKDILVESKPEEYDDSHYQDEEDIDPEVLERLKRDRKFYEEWKARGRVPTLLSRNASRQSERRMGHPDL